MQLEMIFRRRYNVVIMDGKSWDFRSGGMNTPLAQEEVAKDQLMENVDDPLVALVKIVGLILSSPVVKIVC